MDLTNMIPGGAGEEKTPQQQLSKEEYAAMKKQQREEVWAEVDAQAQAVFQNGDSLKGFLDFMAQCNTQKTPNLLLIYGQNPEATVVKSYDYWKKEHRSPKSGVHGYTYMVSTEYEKDGEMRTGYAIGKGFDISQMSGKPLEERPQRSMEELIHAVLKDQPVRMQIADNLPEGIQAQYIPKQRTVYVRNGMDENTTFHAVNRELACAALDQHDGNYARKKVNAQAYCAAYVIGKRYGAEVSGFQFGKVAEMQVVNVLNFEIHLKKSYSGDRYIERITECIPVEEKNNYTFDHHNEPTMEGKMDKFIDNATNYFTKITETETYHAVNIVEFVDGEYVIKNRISDKNLEEMRENMSEEDQFAFDKFVDQYFDISTGDTVRRVVE